MKPVLKLFHNEDEIEVGIDEAGRGPLIGRVYVAGVILPKEFPDDTYLQIKDSKKLSKKKRAILRKYIEEHALDYSVQWADENQIDDQNILHATLNTMHKVLDNLKTKPENILVDGNAFNIYRKCGEVVPHMCVRGGDNKYLCIAAASILAKEYHDEYMRKLVEDNPDLEVYGLKTNVGYGTKVHMEAIKKYGVSKYHRMSFKPCCYHKKPM